MFQDCLRKDVKYEVCNATVYRWPDGQKSHLFLSERRKANPSDPLFWVKYPAFVHDNWQVISVFQYKNINVDLLLNTHRTIPKLKRWKEIPKKKKLYWSLEVDHMVKNWFIYSECIMHCLCLCLWCRSADSKSPTYWAIQLNSLARGST